MPTFTLTIETDNAAFEDSPTGELGRILTDTAQRLSDGFLDGPLLDSNGNTVGRYGFDD